MNSQQIAVGVYDAVVGDPDVYARLSDGGPDEVGTENKVADEDGGVRADALDPVEILPSTE